jgi:hypothetical protein
LCRRLSLAIPVPDAERNLVRERNNDSSAKSKPICHLDDSGVRNADSSARSRAANQNPLYANSNPKLTNNKNPQLEPISAKTWKNRRLFGKIETHSFDFGINLIEKINRNPFFRFYNRQNRNPVL